jgi:hypothetical protein
MPGQSCLGQVKHTTVSVSAVAERRLNRAQRRLTATRTAQVLRLCNRFNLHSVAGQVASPESQHAARSVWARLSCGEATYVWTDTRRLPQIASPRRRLLIARVQDLHQCLRLPFKSPVSH